MSSDPKLIPYILPLIDGQKILDVACGKGKWGYLLKVDFWYTYSGRPLKKQQLEYMIGIDIYLPYLKFAKKYSAYNDVVLCDALHLPFCTKAFEVSIATEILEHLPKKQGSHLLQEIERVSSKSTIITTPHQPLGLLSQDTKDKNVYQKHVSKWSSIELIALGYTSIGRSYPFEKLFDIIFYLFPRLTGIFPQTPSCFIAKKRLNNKRAIKKS